MTKKPNVRKPDLEFSFMHYEIPKTETEEGFLAPGVCGVSVWDEGKSFTVEVIDAPSPGMASVIPRLAHVATCIHKKNFSAVPPELLRWKLRRLSNNLGVETLQDVTLEWDGKQYTQANLLEPEVVGDYRVSKFVSGHEDVFLEVGYDDAARNCHIYYKDYPKLKDATPLERGIMALQQGSTIIEWPCLGLMVRVRDVIRKKQ